jgi:hypothetical protein
MDPRLSVSGLIYVLVEAFRLVQGIQQLKEWNKRPEPPVIERFKDGYTRIIVTDTITRKTDTLRLVDYVKLKKRGMDTVNTKTELFYPGVKYR